MRLQSLPRCRAAPGERAWGAAGLGWCSPQSSVPRQTVGHHARAAMYEMGLTAACEGCRGEVPRLCLDIPPTGACFVPFSYTHRPGRSGRHGPAGSWVDFPIPQKSFVWVLLKLGSRAPTRGGGTGGPPGPGPAPACPRQPCGVALGGGRAPPTCLPYTPTGLPYTAPPALHPLAPKRLPPRPPTLHPAGLPYTQVAYPTPRLLLSTIPWGHGTDKGHSLRLCFYSCF